jgi:hypothetical protein
MTLRYVCLLLMAIASPALGQRRTFGERTELRAEVTGCYMLRDSSGANLPSEYYGFWPHMYLDSTTLRTNRKSETSGFRFAIALDSAGRSRGKQNVAVWWADSLTDSIRISFSTGSSGAFVTLSAPPGVDTLRGRIENHWDVGPSITDQRAIRAERVSCRAA